MSRKLQFLLTVPLLLYIFTACKKGNDGPPSPATTFAMKDSLKIDAFFAINFPDIIARYNNHQYTVNSTNKTLVDVEKTGTDITIYIVDTSEKNLNPALKIVLSNTLYEILHPSYDLTQVYVENQQDFIDGTRNINTLTVVQKGLLKIIYDSKFNTISGEIVNLRMPISYYVPEDISVSTRNFNATFLSEGGSSRTINMTFANIKVK